MLDLIIMFIFFIIVAIIYVYFKIKRIELSSKMLVIAGICFILMILDCSLELYWFPNMIMAYYIAGVLFGIIVYFIITIAGIGVNVAGSGLKYLDENKDKIIEKGIESKDKLVSTAKDFLNPTEEIISTIEQEGIEVEKNFDYKNLTSEEKIKYVRNRIVIKEKKVRFWNKIFGDKS